MPPTGHLHAARAAGRRLIVLPLCCQPTQRDLVCSRQLCACTSFRLRSAFRATFCTRATTREASLSRPTIPCHHPSPELRVGQAVQAQTHNAVRKPVNVRVTSLAHQIWSQVLSQGDLVVDATCGRGADTLWLANAVGPQGIVYALDIQDEAIRSSQARLEEEMRPDTAGQVKFICDSHANLQVHLPGDAAVMLTCFNLGYLPSGNKSLTTQADSTLVGLKAAAEVTAPGGLISIISYTHHPGGRAEFEAIQEYASKLPPDAWMASETHFRNRQIAPVLFNIYKLPSR